MLLAKIVAEADTVSCPRHDNPIQMSLMLVQQFTIMYRRYCRPHFFRGATGGRVILSLAD
jgi:hypothetical protein